MIHACVILGVLFFAAPANAHGAISGGGGFYAGASHPFVAWDHLLVLLGIGLLLGRRPKRDAGFALISLAVALLAGLAAGAAGQGLTVVPGTILGLAILGGVQLASGLPPPKSLMAVFSFITGVCIGLDTDAPMLTVASDVDDYTTYIGVFVAIFLIVLEMFALSLPIRRPPFTIGVRIVGSWIAAVSLMVLALQFRSLTGSA